MKGWAGIVGAAAILAACSSPPPTRIDGESAETFTATTAAARRELSNRDMLTFDTAIRTVGGRRHGNNDPDAMARQTFDGMTAADVVADAHARGIE